MSPGATRGQEGGGRGGGVTSRGEHGQAAFPQDLWSRHLTVMLCSHNIQRTALSWESGSLGPSSCVAPSGHCTPPGLSFCNYKRGMVILAVLPSWDYCKGPTVMHSSSRLIDTEIRRAKVFSNSDMPSRALCMKSSTWAALINGPVVNRITWKS